MRVKRLGWPSLRFPAHHGCMHAYSSIARPARPSEALKILFCGSDRFSIASLRALNEAKRNGSVCVDDIEVVHRPAKRTGRGLKVLKEVEIKQVADELGLRTHVIDTFTGFASPPVNLIVAVSFGLFIPPRILNAAKYGGLNVHPSLLPDLRGPAPIEHAILKSRTHTGVSIQTLHPKKFDAGTVLAQTPAPGVIIEGGIMKGELEDRLAEMGASMLVDVVRHGGHVPPYEDVGWYRKSDGPMDHAPKVTKEDQRVDFARDSLHYMDSVKRAVGDPWCWLSNDERLILHDFGKADGVEVQVDGVKGSEIGIWMQEDHGFPLFRAACGTICELRKSTISGGKIGGGNQRLKKMLQSS